MSVMVTIGTAWNLPVWTCEEIKSNSVSLPLSLSLSLTPLSTPVMISWETESVSQQLADGSLQSYCSLGNWNQIVSLEARYSPYNPTRRVLQHPLLT